MSLPRSQRSPRMSHLSAWTARERTPRTTKRAKPTDISFTAIPWAIHPFGKWEVAVWASHKTKPAGCLARLHILVTCAWNCILVQLVLREVVQRSRSRPDANASTMQARARNLNKGDTVCPECLIRSGGGRMLTPTTSTTTTTTILLLLLLLLLLLIIIIIVIIIIRRAWRWCPKVRPPRPGARGEGALRAIKKNPLFILLLYYRLYLLLYNIFILLHLAEGRVAKFSRYRSAFEVDHPKKWTTMQQYEVDKHRITQFSMTCSKKLPWQAKLRSVNNYCVRG